MTINRFEEGFDDTDGPAHRLPPANSLANPRPALGHSHETEDSLDPEPEFSFGDAAEPEPDYSFEDWDDPEPEPDPDELWSRTRDEEDPSVSPPPAPQAACEPLAALQEGEAGLGKARRQKASQPFIKGPLCREWFIRAGKLPKPAINVGIALWFKVGVEKDDFIRPGRAESIEVRVDRGLKKRFMISPPQLSRGLHALERAGLIRIVKGGAGRCPVVVILNVQIPPPVGRKSST